MSTCQRCHTDFTCGMADAQDSNTPCWCTELPPLPPQVYQAPGAGIPAGCYCPACLRQLVDAAHSDAHPRSS